MSKLSPFLPEKTDGLKNVFSKLKGQCNNTQYTTQYILYTTMYISTHCPLYISTHCTMYSEQASSLRLVEHYSKLFSLFSPPSPPQDVVTCSHHVPHRLLRPAPRTRSVPERERYIETNAHTLQIDVRYPGTYQNNIGGVIVHSNQNNIGEGGYCASQSDCQTWVQHSGDLINHARNILRCIHIHTSRFLLHSI